ncbi:MAG TPA: GNAT family N-acetyltransferase [Candidatus Binataceae bacterium]|nr:GNAT family N-acetyltransferase [Candidatus Binataceae bacterium]
MEIRAARPSERDEVLDLLGLWFGDRSFFARYNQNDPRFRDQLCLIARDGGAIVSTVQIFDRAINLEGQSVPMGGIGSVFTREDYRHKGVASALMRLAVETMAREGFEVSLLFAERLTFYNQFGWRAVAREFSLVANTQALRVPAHYQIDVFDPSRDLATVARLHRAYSGRFNVTALRDNADWTANLIYAGNQPEQPGAGSKEYFVLCRDGGQIRAYARAMPFAGVAMVMEYGYEEGANDAMAALFKHLGEAASGRPHSLPLSGDHRGAAILRIEGAAPAPDALVSHTAHDPRLEEHLAGAGAIVNHHDDRNYMWRVIAPEKLARRFGGTAEEASRRAFAMFEDPRSLYWTSDRF